MLDHDFVFYNMQYQIAFREKTNMYNFKVV